MKGTQAYVEKYSMVISTNITSICCVYKEKIVKKKTTHTKERSLHTKLKSCNV